MPIDTRLLSDAVIELNISRKNVSIYPPGHIQITKSIDRAFEVLMKMFEIRQEMTLGVAKDTLFVGQDYLDQRNPVYKDFALSLNQQGIAAVTFIRGLDRAELERFHRIITTKQEEIESLGGIAKVVENAGIPHIRVMAIDYASFHLTEEKEIFKAQPKAGEKPGDKPGAGVWQDFVSLLSTGTLATAGEGVSLKDSSQIDPAELAKLLNERKLDSGAAVQSYDRIISSYVRTSAERKQLTKEQSETIANLNKLTEGPSSRHPEAVPVHGVQERVGERVQPRRRGGPGRARRRHDHRHAPAGEHGRTRDIAHPDRPPGKAGERAGPVRVRPRRAEVLRQRAHRAQRSGRTTPAPEASSAPRPARGAERARKGRRRGPGDPSRAHGKAVRPGAIRGLRREGIR